MAFPLRVLVVKANVSSEADEEGDNGGDRDCPFMKASQMSSCVISAVLGRRVLI